MAAEIVDHLHAAAIVLDCDGLVVTINPAGEALLGVSRGRARGRPLLELVDDRLLEDLLVRAIATGRSFADVLKLGAAEPEGGERFVECSVSPMQVGGGAALLLVEMTDITRRSRITRENALIVQHAAGRQMIRQLAHEIKNPLGGLRGAAQLLGKQLASDELREYTSVIISEADRLAALVDTLLGPGGTPNRQPVNIHELLDYVWKLIEPDVRNKLELRRDYDPGLPLIDLDRDQMVQAILNLVRNATIALGGRGTIILRSRATMNFTIGDIRHSAIATIEVEDDGPGIPLALQDSVFYPLVTGRPDGTGLGLSVAQDLLARHGGLIEFDSRPGRTVFLVRIPLVRTVHELP